MHLREKGRKERDPVEGESAHPSPSSQSGCPLITPGSRKLLSDLIKSFLGKPTFYTFQLGDYRLRKLADSETARQWLQEPAACSGGKGPSCSFCPPLPACVLLPAALTAPHPARHDLSASWASQSPSRG